MKNEFISDALDLLDDDMIIETAVVRNKKKHSSFGWLKWGAIAACVCFVTVSAFQIFNHESPKKNIQRWSKHFAAEDYFKYSNEERGNISTSTILSDSIPPYTEARFFSEERHQLESEGVIPIMVNHPLFDCEVDYNEDGSIYCIKFVWHSRGDAYSDLSITAGFQEVEQIQDYIVIEVDDNGNIIPPAVTVTERDGIQIIAEGKENWNKTITFQNDSGWYQIEGSWNDNFASVVELLDWIWEHPVDFTKFPIEAGDEFTYIQLTEYPDAFANYIPNFEAFGYVNEFTTLVLKNGEPYSFEGNYIAHADEKSIKEGTYSEIDGWTNIHWCIDTEPNYYDIKDSLGELEDLTEQTIQEVLKNESNFAFLWNDYFIRVYTKSSKEAWNIIEMLQK